jgi:hypothetical protein
MCRALSGGCCAALKTSPSTSRQRLCCCCQYDCSNKRSMVWGILFLEHGSGARRLSVGGSVWKRRRVEDAARLDEGQLRVCMAG